MGQRWEGRGQEHRGGTRAEVTVTKDEFRPCARIGGPGNCVDTGHLRQWSGADLAVASCSQMARTGRGSCFGERTRHRDPADTGP